MAKQDIDIGVEGNDGTGDSIRESFRKVNENFNEIYAVFGEGGQISFTNLNDTPDTLVANSLMRVSDDARTIDFIELASDSASDPNLEDSIIISSDIAGKLILSTAFRALSQDTTPTLGGPLDADGRAIANVGLDQNAVNEFNASQVEDGSTPITIDDLVITKGYADNRYVSTALPVRVDDEPIDASEYTYAIAGYENGNILIPNHGFDRTVNGTAFRFSAEDVIPIALQNDPINTVYYVRYATSNTLALFRNRADAITLTQSIADSARIFITHTIAPGDNHALIDGGYNPDLQGFFLEDEAIPRKSVVRRQGDKMTGPLILHDSPGELAGLASGDEDLQAATKFYVDNTSYSSLTNIFVSTSGDDTMRGVPQGKEGTSWSYAYRTINKAAQRAEEVMRASVAEPGPYMQTITRDDGAAEAEVLSGSINNPTFTQARNLITLNREFIIKEVTAYLKFTFPDFDYNIDTCERDLGLILDSIAFDINRALVTDEARTNSLTRLAAERYYVNSSGRIAITRQLIETTSAISRASDIVNAILLNRPLERNTISNVTLTSGSSLFTVVETAADHGYANGNIVEIKEVQGTTQLNGSFYYIKVTSDTTFQLFLDEDLEVPLDSEGFTAYTGGGVVGLKYQTDAKQVFDLGNNADQVARIGVQNNFNLINTILTNGIDSGATIVNGRTYNIVVNNGVNEYTDQGNPENRDVLPGKVLVGKISGAQGRIVNYFSSNDEGNPDTSGDNDVIEVQLLKPIEFITGEALEYGNFVKKAQVTIFIESGQYEEDYPIRVSANVSVVGDEFRRVIIRPKDRVSQSPWANTYLYRDRFFDDIPVTDSGARFYNQTGQWQGHFGYHYLTNPEKPIYTGNPVTNAGSYFVASDILTENKKFIQEEVIAYIDQNYKDLIYDKDVFRTTFEEIMAGISFDVAFGTNYNQNLYGVKFWREQSIYRTPDPIPLDANNQPEQTLLDLWVEALTLARTQTSGLFDVISDPNGVSRVTDAFNQIINIIENGSYDTDDQTTTRVFSNTDVTTVGNQNTRDRLQANKEFIAQEGLAYLKSLSNRKYFNDEVRLRDYRQLVDALTYDVLYGGNFAMREYAKDLFINGELRFEVTTNEVSYQAFVHLNNVIQDVIQNNTVTPTAGHPALADTPINEQDTSGTPVSSAEVTTVDLYMDTYVLQRVENRNILGLPGRLYPDTNGINGLSLASKTAIDGATTTIRDNAILQIDNTILFNYNRTKCRRDVGLIVNALADDLAAGGDEFSLEVQGEYYSSYINQYNTSGGFSGQENVTKNAIEFIGDVASRLFTGNYSNDDLEQNPLAGSYIAPDVQFGPAEDNVSLVVSNLINRITIAFDKFAYNPPKRNDQTDVFMMNDATILRNITVQGHGGFLCILDPAGQILTKSPYIQTGSSFSKSINKKHFAGGMFVDAYSGNLPAYIPETINPFGDGDISGKINNFDLWVRSEEGQGLFIRPPELPCPFYIEGKRFQVNAIANYDQANGWCRIILDKNSNPDETGVGQGYVESQFEENPGVISREIFLQTAGNRSMLGNDFTQINDLGYGLVTTNGAFSEMVSMFTYYCQAAYYAANGSEIRSLNGSNGYGFFGLVSEGADPNEIPDQVLYRDDSTYSAKGFTVREGQGETGTFTNLEGDPSILVTDLPVAPLPDSLITINHPDEAVLEGKSKSKNYRISVVRELGDGTNSGDLTNGGIIYLTNIGTVDPLQEGTYSGVTNTTGSTRGGINAEFTVIVSNDGSVVVNIDKPGTLYLAGTTLTIDGADLGGGSSLTFDIEYVGGYDGVTHLDPGKYSDRVYELQIVGTPAGTNLDFYSSIKADVQNGEILEYRNGQTHIFKGISNRLALVTRPSTAVNFDESDEITYRSIAFGSFDSVGTELPETEVSTTFEIEYDSIELFVDSEQAEGSTIGDVEIAIIPDSSGRGEGYALDDQELQRITRDINGNYPPETLVYTNANDLIIANIGFVEEEAIAFNTDNGFLNYNDEEFRNKIRIALANIAFDLQHQGNARTINFAADYWGEVLQNELSQNVAALNFARDLVNNYILPNDPSGYTPQNTNGATQTVLGSAAETGATTRLTELMNIITSVIVNSPSVAPTKTGYEGGMLVTWAGRTHSIVRYTESSQTKSIIELSRAPINYVGGSGGLGIAAPFTRDKILNASIQKDTTAEITVAISLCRATGHDFTQIGTGGFNTSNYPNVILGQPELELATYYTSEPTATSAQVWERRKGRVFWMSTDQFGFFRVGKFFEVDQGEGSIKFSGTIGITGANALGFQKGVTIDEFSIDDTMADESDNAVPVEKAIVNYVDKRLGRDKNDSPASSLIGPGYLSLSGSSTMNGELRMGGQKIVNLRGPDNGSDAATKGYVDTNLQEFDSYEAIRNTSSNRPEKADLVLYTGVRKIFTTIPEDQDGSNQLAVDDSIRDQSSTKSGTIIDIEPITDAIIGEFEPGNNIWIIYYTLDQNSPDFIKNETLFGVGTKNQVEATILREPFLEVGHARESEDSVINFSITRPKSIVDQGLTNPIAEINFQIENETIINADISPTASIAQSKTLMQRAAPLPSSLGLMGLDTDASGQGLRGLSAFDGDVFTHEIEITTSGNISVQEGDYIYQGLNKGTVITTVSNDTIITLRTSNEFTVGATDLTKAVTTNGVEQAATSLGVSVNSIKASGFIGLAENSITFEKLKTIDSQNVLGRNTNGTGLIEEVTFETVVDKGFGLQDVDFENSENIIINAQIITFPTPISVEDGETLTQIQGGSTTVTGTVQGKVDSETQVIVVNGTATFNNTTNINGSISGGLGTPIGVQSSENILGKSLIEIRPGIYGTTTISIGNAANTIARRTNSGSLQADSFIIGGSSTNEILAEAGGTLTFKTPNQGTILTSSGGNVSVAPFVNVPGSLNVGDTGSTNEGNAQGNVSALTGKGFVSSTWMYSNFIEALDTKETNNTTGIALGAPATYANSAAGSIILVNQNNPTIEVTSSLTKVLNNFNINDVFTVSSSNGNTSVSGNLAVQGGFSAASLGADGDLSVGGDLAVADDLTVNGDTTLGNASTDQVTINGLIQASIVPKSGANLNLGSNNNPWSTVYGTTFTGTSNRSKYADLAENYVGDADYEPGTVVVLGGEKEVTITTTYGDTRVAGVVTTNPGYLMNEDLEAEYVVGVALTGRVPCKVLGTVSKGDILVASAIPGYAIVDNKANALAMIGKAISTKDDDGKGVVEILVLK